jgi:transposase
VTAKAVGIRRQAGRGADGRRAVDRLGRVVGAGRVQLPKKERRFRYPGRKRLPGRQTLQGILFVLHTGIAWQHLPTELGFGSGVTCRRRLDEWQRAGVWERLHELLLTRLRAAGEIEWARAIADSSQVQAKKGAPRRDRARWTEAVPAPSTISSSTRPGSRSPSRLPARTATTSPS